MTLDDAKNHLNKAIEAYQKSLSPIKAYDTPGGSTLTKQSPEVLRKQVTYWERRVKFLEMKANGETIGGVSFREGAVK